MSINMFNLLFCIQQIDLCVCGIAYKEASDQVTTRSDTQSHDLSKDCVDELGHVTNQIELKITIAATSLVHKSANGHMMRRHQFTNHVLVFDI